MPTFSLGSETFIYLNREDIPGGSPEIVREDMEAYTRPGTDGTAIRKNGLKGKPFLMRSCAAATDGAAATSGINAYAALIGASPLVLIWDELNYSTGFDTKYVVMDVRQVDMRQVYNLIVDGSILTAAILVYAVWELMPVEAS